MPAGEKRDVGALDWIFTTHRPSGKDIQISFDWKKRPVDLADGEWPVDTMGFTAERPDGKHTAFRMTRKSRPVPAGYGTEIRPGLGQATMEFESRHPDGATFRFTWEKIPAVEPEHADDAPERAAERRPDEPAAAGTARGSAGSATKKKRSG